MATFTAGGSPILALHLREPRRGVWTADVELDGAAAWATNAGSTWVELDLGGVLFSGTVVRAGVEAGRTKARIAGGAGGLGHELDARSYRDVPLATVLADVLSDAGESLGSSVDLSTHLVGQWTRAAGPGAAALDDVARAAGAAWRVGRDGQVVLAQDLYPPASLSLETATLTGEDPQLGRATLAPPDGSILAPATTWRGRLVELVVTTIERRTLRQEAWLA